MGAAPPWGQSSLRSCLAPHSFPPPPPHDGPSAARTIPGSEGDRPQGVPTADSTSRGVGAGRSAQRGTSGATTGPRGRAALPLTRNECVAYFSAVGAAPPTRITKPLWKPLL